MYGPVETITVPARQGGQTTAVWVLLTHNSTGTTANQVSVGRLIMVGVDPSTVSITAASQHALLKTIDVILVASRECASI